jgi:antibiotic biosynthesis monooxygenase (ABM) superfamily enzyme
MKQDVLEELSLWESSAQEEDWARELLDREVEADTTEQVVDTSGYEKWLDKQREEE